MGRYKLIKPNCDNGIYTSSNPMRCAKQMYANMKRGNVSANYFVMHNIDTGDYYTFVEKNDDMHMRGGRDASLDTVTIVDTDGAVKKVSDDIDKVSDDIDDAKEALKQDIGDVQDDIDAVTKEARDAQRDVQDALDKIKRIRNDLEDKIQALEDKLSKKIDDIEQKPDGSQNVTTIITQMTDMESKIESLNAKIASLSAQVAAFSDKRCPGLLCPPEKSTANSCCVM